MWHFHHHHRHRSEPHLQSGVSHHHFGETSATPTLNYEVNLYENGSPALTTLTAWSTPHPNRPMTSVGVSKTQHGSPVRLRHHWAEPAGRYRSEIDLPHSRHADRPRQHPQRRRRLHPVVRLVGLRVRTSRVSTVRSAGVYFPGNGKFYAMGGRSADTAGSDFTHPFEYDPATNAWTTKGAT